MLQIKVDAIHLEYDIHSLVKSFYPQESLKITAPDQPGAFLSLCSKDCFMELMLQDETPRAVIRDQKNESAADDVAKLSDASDASGHQMNCADDCFVYEVEDCDRFELATANLDSDDATYIQVDKAYKNEFKAFLYKALCQYTGQELPWGNLIGIRPVKLAVGLVDAGKSDEEIDAFLRDNHFVSEGKRKLSLGIARREHEIFSHIHKDNGYSLYIGIPFCPTRCLYCSFTSNPLCKFEKQVDSYIDCLIKEMEWTAEQFKDQILDTVYIGGGTPTTLSAEQLDRLITALEDLFDLSHMVEFTVEAGRADSITREKLQVLYDHKVTRISVNPQTMKQDTLKLIGRNHTVDQVVDAFHLAREIGFDNINMDMILGLPGETAEDVSNTVEKIKQLRPDSLTVHSLAIKRASRLREMIDANHIYVMENTDETMEIAARAAEEMDMEAYYLYRQKNMSGNFENVGYATPGKFGVYNILIMEEVQTIVACGAGTVTKRVYPVNHGDGVSGSNCRIERCDNIKDVELYMEKIDEMIERKKHLFADEIDP